MKRILSMLLVAAMLMGMLPVSAMADEVQTAVEKTAQLQTVLEEPAVSVTAVATTPVPLASGTFEGHTYYYYGSNGYTWDEVVAFCASMGGYPASISSQEENDFLYQLVRSAGAYNAHFGLTDLEESRVWKWVNGEEVVYTNWASGEPNDTDEHYAMFYDKYTTGKWNDGVFSGSPFLLEVASASNSLEGVCGDGVNWHYEGGVLTISGEGVINDNAFKGNPGITSVVIEEGVTGIGASAFQNCTGLVSITLPDSLTSIGSSAFNGCTVLAALELPEGLTRIDSYAFKNCDALTEITIPASVTMTDNGYWFEGCDGLINITIAEGATSIPKNAFFNLKTAFNITIPDTVTAIGEAAFSDCSGMNSISLPDSLLTISYRAFRNCTGLTEINIPDSVTFIGGGAFENSSSLARVILSDGLKQIDYHAFYNCDALTEITIPASVTMTDNGYWFEGCDGLTSITIAEGATVIPKNAFCNLKTAFNIAIPDTVTSVGEAAFSDCSGMNSISLPDSLLTISYRAFRNCTGLTEICIPDSVTFIGGGAFENSSSLTQVVLPNSLKQIDYHAFYNCDALTEITIPASVTTTDNGYWFEGCDNLTQIIIADGSTVIPDGAFRNLYTDFEIIIPNTVTAIEDNAFYNCTGLTSIVLPDSVTYIDDNAFRDCVNLTSITLSDSLTTIDKSAFESCTAMTEIDLPDSLTAIYGWAFYNCDGLTEIAIPAGVVNSGDGYWFGGCDNLTRIIFEDGATLIPYQSLRNLQTDFDVVIPATVTHIDDHAFRDCVSLTSVILPEGLVTIDRNAFENCTSLTEIDLPDSLTAIYGWAFYNCDGLTEIAIPAGVVNSGDGYWFGGCDNLTRIIFEDGATLIPYQSLRNLQTDFDVVIPATVTHIDDHAFRDCVNLTSVILPEGLVTIDRNAFESCTSLTEIDLPDSLTAIYGWAFYNCDGLTEIVIPSGVVSSGDGYWFQGCDNLTRITFAEGATTIPYQSLRNLQTDFETVIPDSVTAIGNSAFRDCGKLDKIVIPATVTSMGDAVFMNCASLLTAGPIGGGYDIEFGWTDALPNNAFRACTGITSLVIPEGVTSLGEYAVEYCQALKKIYLPSTLKSIGYRAFRYDISLTSLVLPDGVERIGNQAFLGCTNLQSLTIPDSVTTISGSPFSDCPELVISCSGDSYALEYALQKNLLVNITDWTKADSDILVMENSYYNTNSSDVNASGYIDLVVHYELQEDQIQNLSDMKLRVLLQGTMVLLENSVRLDGVSPEGYSYSNNILTVPVQNASGTLRFSVNPESAARLFSRAELVYTKDGASGSEIIDCINSDMPVLTLVTQATVNTDDVHVSGIAPAEATVTFYIDDVQAGAAVASKAGNYSAELTIPEPVEGQTYAVKASVTVNDTVIEKTMSVTYDLSSPVLEELLLYYSGHEKGYYENYVVDMTDPHAGRTVITFNPSMTYTFRVKMTNPEMISCLYVTSTRNGQTKYIEAVYDEASGYFVTSDKFDKDVWNYVPGEIGVIFDLSYSHIDREDPEAVAEALIDETAADIDLTGATAEVIESDENDLNLLTTLPDGTEISYEYHEFNVQEFYDYLCEIGFADTPDVVTFSTSNDANKVLDAVKDLLYEGLKEYKDLSTSYYVGQTEDGKLLTVSLDNTVEAENQVIKTWCIDTAGKNIVSYMLDPDSLHFGVSDELSNLSGEVYSVGKFTLTYFGRMWQLEMQEKGASEIELQHIRETQELLTFVLVSKVVFAVAKVSLSLAFPYAAVGIEVGYFLLSDLLDNIAEEEDWVKGFENSMIGMFLEFPQLLEEAFWLFLADNLLKWIIDPSGYVYEAVTDNRLSGVTATVYYQDPETGEAILWDAGEYDQVNPIITRGDGVYAWDVPEGLWQVKYELDGYETVYSDWMEVPPPQTDVNVGLVSYAVPEAQWIDVYHDSVEITFSKYMIPETVDGITLTDENGNTIGYSLVYDDSQTGADGTVYAREFTLEFDSAILDSGDACGITIPATVQSYAGVGAAAATLSAVCTEQIVISAADTVTVPYGGTAMIPVSLSAADLEIEVISMFAELLTVDALEQTGANSWNITVSGTLPGATAILITVPGTNISKTVTIQVERAAHVHTAVTDNAVSATCTESGLTEGSHCGECGQVLIPQTQIPALGHTWDDGTVTREPTAEVEGEILYTCTVCGATRTEAIALVEQVNWVSVSVSLAGDIGLNYYVELSGDLVANENACVQFTFAGGTQTVPMAEAVYSNGSYRFSCAVPAKHMADPVTAQVYVGSAPVGQAKTYSVKAYCDAAVPVYSQYAAYANLVTLMKAMLNYGAYSQLSLGYATDNLANAGLTEAERLLPETVDASAYAHSVIGSEDGIMVYSASLLLESKTTIRFYFRLTGDKTIDRYEFQVNGVATTPTASGSLYYVDVPNVAAKDLDEMQTVNVGGMQVSYCGLSYVNQMMTWSGITEAGLNVVKALYVYNQAANAYFE